jgi:hypothetical protein
MTTTKTKIKIKTKTESGDGGSIGDAGPFRVEGCPNPAVPLLPSTGCILEI